MLEETSIAPHPALISAGKLRILLQTVTDLVPGSDPVQKHTFLQNAVCQQHWNRDFGRLQERWYPYRGFFGLKNRKCFFLIDHFGHDHNATEEEVPVLWYKWTGDSLERVHENIPPKFQKELKKWPFTWEGKKWNLIPLGPDGKYAPKDRREVINSSLHQGRPILEEDHEFLRENPEHAQWLKDNMEPELWAKIEPFRAMSGEKVGEGEAKRS